ncbi:MAG: hypothetical protein KDC88_02050 [Ignavibacteriae bacterium]|nr:hypothetical protein [Ignavibacteriota bacterium]MCB9208337.1 hypothetical protein [Ignavibacteriales bacterium]MCB9259099.1 hypothetical protein [Ignavibacteriales bacterium]
MAKVILILLFLGSCTSVDYIILNDNKIDSKSDIGIITFNIKAIYEKEELEIDDLMKLINNGTNDFVVFQELFDESTREKIIERADRNKFSTVIARVDYNSFPEFIFQDAGLFMMSKYPKVDLSNIDFGCDVENSEGVVYTILEKEFSSTNDFLANKSVAGSLFKIDENNMVFLFTAHVQAAGTLEHKLFQLEQIGTFIETTVQKIINEKIIDTPENLTVILAGDFNSNAYSSDRFESMMKALKYPRDLHKEFHGTNEEYTFKNRTRRYDYILSYDKIGKYELNKINVHSIGVLDITTSKNESISDHLAIKASFNLENAKFTNKEFELSK